MEVPIIIHTNRFRPGPNWTLAAHRHESFHELICVVSGRIETRLCGQVLRGAPGDVLFYPRGEMHAERSVGQPPLESIFAQFQWPNTDNWPLMRHDHFGRISFLAKWLADLAPAPAQRQLIQPALLLAMLHEYPTLVSDPEREGINLAKRFALEHVAEPIQLRDMAAVSGLSRFHFAHSFQRSTGIPPMRYLRQLRVEQARTLLLSTDLPLKIIAARCGFTDMYQLSRAFKRVTGQSPGSLRTND